MKALDIFFVVFHTTLILFNIFGWIWKNTRKLNLICLLLTAFSWIILGIWYGFGYCPLTEWHFDILEKLGQRNLPSSYIEYLAERITGLQFEESSIDMVTIVLFVAALACSIYLNIKDYKNVKSQTSAL